MSYVTPSGNMAVRPGQYVSGEGRVYHPYLAGWQPDVSVYSRSLGFPMLRGVIPFAHGCDIK